MVDELREMFSKITDALNSGGYPMKNVEKMMVHVADTLESMNNADERIILLTEMQVLINAALTSDLDGMKYRIFHTDVDYVLLGCIMTLLKEFSHGDLS